jgi:hypothetical protein
MREAKVAETREEAQFDLTGAVDFRCKKCRRPGEITPAA